MKYSLHFLLEVEDDAFSVRSWYESKSVGLGDEFLNLFYENALDITDNPLLYQKVHGEVRRRLMKTISLCNLFQDRGLNSC